MGHTDSASRTKAQPRYRLLNPIPTRQTPTQTPLKPPTAGITRPKTHPFDVTQRPTPLTTFLGIAPRGHGRPLSTPEHHATTQRERTSITRRTDHVPLTPRRPSQSDSSAAGNDCPIRPCAYQDGWMVGSMDLWPGVPPRVKEATYDDQSANAPGLHQPLPTPTAPHQGFALRTSLTAPPLPALHHQRHACRDDQRLLPKPCAT
jgi:hypothetical protein